MKPTDHASINSDWPREAAGLKSGEAKKTTLEELGGNRLRKRRWGCTTSDIYKVSPSPSHLSELTSLPLLRCINSKRSNEPSRRLGSLTSHFLERRRYGGGMKIAASEVPRQKYCESIHRTVCRKTRTVLVGNVALGSEHPIRIQTMTTSDTKDVDKTVEELKKLHLLTSKKVQLILTNKPRLFYVDPSKSMENMKIKWSDKPNDISVQVLNSSHFKPMKISSFEDKKKLAWHWKKAIESLVNY